MTAAKTKLHEIVDELTEEQANRVLEMLGDEPFSEEWRDEIARRIAEVEAGDGVRAGRRGLRQAPRRACVGVTYERAEIPEGTEVVVMIADDEPDDSERAKIIAAIERSMDQVEAGKHVDAEVVIARLLSRG